jgi:hypothetical protein
VFRPRDELRHPEGDVWSFVLEAPALRVELVAAPEGVWRYQAVLDRGDDLVAVIDDEVPPPSNGTLEIRTEGLWAEVVVESAYDHVSLGCEAFGLRVDPPLDLTVPLLGDRVPFGLDLGFETEGPLDAIDGGYALPCLADGVILLGADEIRVERAPGHRTHTWPA